MDDTSEILTRAHIDIIQDMSSNGVVNKEIHWENSPTMFTSYDFKAAKYTLLKYTQDLLQILI